MLLPGFGWPTDNIWIFTLPTADPSYCVVIETVIIDVTEDGVPGNAVYFHDNEACTQPCTSISIDPDKVLHDLKFKIQSTFSNSND